MSAAADLIQGLSSQGVALIVEGDQLIVRAPKGSVDQETLEELRRRKLQLIAELSVEDRSSPGTVAGRDARIQREARRQKVLQMMAEDDQPRKYYWATDDKAHSEFVFLTLAIRDVGTCEMSIPKEKYDPFLLMEIIDGQQTGHGEN